MRRALALPLLSLNANLPANFDALVDAVVRAKLSGAKGKCVRKIAVFSTIGPGFKVETAEAAGA